MALRYFIKYFDVVDIEHRFNIYDDSYVGDSVQIDGNVTLTYSETDNPLEAIRGQGLSVQLEASETLTFNDLWGEEEKTLQVEYKRNNVILFQGWLNPEGFFENYVSTNWIVTFDCVDGLGFLENLSFVEDATGLPITQRRTYLELLSLALVRTGLSLNINTNIDIFYTGLSTSLDILDNVYANTERYIKDDGETIMSCEEVIRDILEPFGAVLTSFGGEWYIYKPNQLFNNSTATFFNYTYLGVPSITPTKVLDTSLFIGSNWKGAAIHHCSANQQISNKASIGAYRINYKYGLANDLILNKYFLSLDGSTLPDWDIISHTYLSVPPANESGITLQLVADTALENVINSNTIDVVDGIELDIRTVYNVITNTSSGSVYFNFQVRLDDSASADYYYLDNTNQWLLNSGDLDTFSRRISDSEENIISETTAKTPVSGTVKILIWTPGSIKPITTTAGSLKVTEFSVTNLSETPKTLKGEFHTVEREDKPSSKIEDIKEVATGDSPLDIYEGTLYKADAETPTETWFRKGITEAKPILQIMGEETLRMSQLPARVFRGDVFGFFNYLSTVTIDGLSGIFEPIKYNYDTKANVISAEFRQMYGAELTDIDYKKTFDYGNVVKPTIKG